MTDGQTETDGQTDGIAIAYARLAYICFRAQNRYLCTSATQPTIFRIQFHCQCEMAAGYLPAGCCSSPDSRDQKTDDKINVVFRCNKLNFTTFVSTTSFVGRNLKAFWHCSITDIDLVSNNFIRVRSTVYTEVK